MIYRLRVILDNDTEDDIFRDIELDKTSNLEDFHNTISQSFGFEGNEMASFYLTDQGVESRRGNFIICPWRIRSNQ